MEDRTSEGNPMTTETDEQVLDDTSTPPTAEDPAEADSGTDTDESAGDSFPREYVEKLRQENGRYRQRAQRADELAHRLHRALVAADGRLQDPTDLEFADEHLDDDAALASAIADLLQHKPHLAARRPVGDVGQGATSTPGEVNLLGLLGGT